MDYDNYDDIDNNDNKDINGNDDIDINDNNEWVNQKRGISFFLEARTYLQRKLICLRLCILS